MTSTSPAAAPAPRTRRPRAFVFADPSPEELAGEVDWSPWYLTEEEDVAHAPEHNEASRDFVSCVRELARERGLTAVRIAEDEFFAWVPEEPLVRVSPDVFLVRDPLPPPYPRSWQTWQPGHKPPSFALEIVSEDWKKDYEDNPAKYWQLGARELAIFDPGALREGRRGDRVPLQVYRRDVEGAFVRVYAGSGPARSEELDAWLVVRHEGALAKVRLARDPQGKSLVPTADEALAAAEQRAGQAEQRAGQAEDQAREAERARERLAAKLREMGVDPDALEGPANAESRPTLEGPANAESRPTLEGPANAESRPTSK